MSRSFATGLFPVSDEFDDQITFFVRLRSVRVPLSLRNNTPEVSLSGVSRLATHTTVVTLILLYHIPKYRFVEVFVGLKNPILKVSSSEMMVWPSVRLRLTVMVLDDEVAKRVETVAINRKKEKAAILIDG